jgi:hypothetical protein
MWTIAIVQCPLQMWAPSALANRAGQIDACRFRMQVGAAAANALMHVRALGKRFGGLDTAKCRP